MVDGQKINSFEQLTTWQDSLNISVDIYRITENLPPHEQFGITNQIRRAATSVSANIAEGFGRAGKKEKLQFYSIAYGSLLEVKSFLYLCQKLKYCQDKDVELLVTKITTLQKRINTMLSKVRAYDDS